MTVFHIMALYLLISIPCSHPLTLVGPQNEAGSPSGRPQEKYEDHMGVLLNLPEQPDRAARIELSLILENINLSERINNILIRCMSSNTNTNESSWGAFGVDRFTPSQVQVQYFCIVSEKQSLDFPGVLNAYLSSGNLLRCLHDADNEIPEGVDILSGRNVAAPRSGSIVSATGSTPGWAAGVAVAVVAAIGVMALIVVLLKGEDIYLETDFIDFEKDVLDHENSQDSIDSGKLSSGDESEAEVVAKDDENEGNSKATESDSEGERKSKAIDN